MSVREAKQAACHKRDVVVVDENWETGMSWLNVAENEDRDEENSDHTYDGQPPAVFPRLNKN